MGSFVLFILLAVVAVGSAVLMVTSRNAIHSALWLVFNFVTIAVLYVILNAPFIAMVQITVYAGAIMVLFLFVIMLLGADRLGGVGGSTLAERIIGGLLALALIAGVVLYTLSPNWGDTASAVIQTETGAAGFGGPVGLGLRLFEGYVFPFEVTGALLLTAMIGVVVLSKRKQS